VKTAIFDWYGFGDSDVRLAAELVASATGEVFEPHYTDDWGDYYLSGLTRRTLRIHSNELEDEDGRYIHQPEFAEYPVLLLASDRQNGDKSTSPYLDDLRQNLDAVDGITFLRRRVSVR
jgi:hypothetical protein